MIFNQTNQTVYGVQTNVSGKAPRKFEWIRDNVKRTLLYNHYNCTVSKSKSIEFNAIVEIKYRDITVLTAEINTMSSGVVLVEMYLELMEM